MAIIKSVKDIPTKFKHIDIFNEYKNEIKEIYAFEYAEIVGTTKQNISVKLKNESCLLRKEQINIIEHLERINATNTQLYSKLYIADTEDLSEFSDIPIRSEVSASCGNGCEVYDEDVTDTLPLPNKLLSYFCANKRMTEIIFAKGDSMLPDIKNEDMLLVDKSKTNISNGWIYVFNYNGEVMCKQLSKSNNTIIATSKNPAYAPFAINEVDDFNIVGCVVGQLHPMFRK